MSAPRLLLASGNRAKRDELARLLEPLAVRVLAPDEVGGLPEVLEDGATFAENARKKALSAARASGLLSLADDSGLEVEALGGEPGVASARYAGRHGDDGANRRRVLERLAGRAPSERGARFVCALALARPGPGGGPPEIVAEIDGEARGRILAEPRGQGGFGYDPLFQLTEEGFAQAGRSFAELTPAEKAEVSHRGRALRRLALALPELLGA